MVKLTGDITDEIEQFENMRCIAALEACARFFSLPQSERHPSVQQLPVHLPRKQNIVFEEGRERDVITDVARCKTELTEFFNFNLNNPGSMVKYCDFPYFFFWNKKAKCWIKRRINTGTIGRVYTVHPSAGDRYFYDCCCITIFAKVVGFCYRIAYCFCVFYVVSVTGKTTFDEMLHVGMVKFNSFKEVCCAIGILDDNEEWEKVLNESLSSMSSRQARERFALMLLFCEIRNPLELFFKFFDFWVDDLRRKDPNLSRRILQFYALREFGGELQLRARCLEDFNLPNVTEHELEELNIATDQVIASRSAIFREETDFNHEELRSFVSQCQSSHPGGLYYSQRVFFSESSRFYIVWYPVFGLHWCSWWYWENLSFKCNSRFCTVLKEFYNSCNCCCYQWDCSYTIIWWPHFPFALQSAPGCDGAFNFGYFGANPAGWVNSRKRCDSLGWSSNGKPFPPGGFG